MKNRNIILKVDKTIKILLVLITVGIFLNLGDKFFTSAIANEDSIPEKIMVDFDENKVLKIAICTPSGSRCASVGVAGLEIDND